MELQLLIALHRFNNWPTVKRCKTTETKHVKNFLTNNSTLYGTPQKIDGQKGWRLFRKSWKSFGSWNLEIEFCTLQMHTNYGTVYWAIQTLKNSIKTSMGNWNDLTVSVNWAHRVMLFTIYTELEKVFEKSFQKTTNHFDPFRQIFSFCNRTK